MNGDEWLAAHRAQVDQVMANDTDKARLAHSSWRSSGWKLPFVAEEPCDYGPPATFLDDQRQLAIERIEEPVQVTKIDTEEE